MNRHLSVELRLVLNAIYGKAIFKASDFSLKNKKRVESET